jgi:hypothetical protein
VGYSYNNTVAREDLPKNLTFEQKDKGKEASHTDGTSSVKPPK